MPATCWLLVFILSAIITDIKGQCGDATNQSSYLAPGTRNFFFSPGYPDPYPSNISCRWLLETNEGYRLRLRSTQFQLRTSDSSCADIFRVYDGNSILSPLLFSSCNETFQPINSSSSRYLLVTFTSGVSPSASEGGFFVIYESFMYIVATTTSTTTVLPTTEAVHCGTSNLTAEAGTYGYITSPGFPNAYPSDATCTWSIMADNSSLRAVRLDIVRIDLEFSPNCSLDSITIYDVYSTWREEVRKFCSYLEEPVVSRGQYLLVMFTSDSAFSGRGFLLRYTSVAKPTSTSTTVSTRSTSTLPTTTRQSVISVTPPSNGTECSSTPVSLNVFIGQVGYLQSPNYPQNYINNADCQWRISTDNNFFVKVTVEAASLEQCTICGSCDSLEIFDGTSTLATKLGTVCDTTLQTVFFSSGPQLYLRLRTDTSVVFPGFTLRYEAVASISSPTPMCSSTFSSLMSSYGKQKLLRFESFANQGSSQTCSWVIRSDVASRVVRVSFDYFNMQDCSNGDCECGFLDIFDGMSELSPRLVRLCGTKVMPLVMLSTGNSLYLTFNSRGTWHPKAFALQYESVPRVLQSQALFPGTAPPTTNSCSTHPVRLKAMYGDDRLLASPSFLSQSSTVNTYCDWLITSDPGFVIQLTTITMNLEDCRYCNCQRIDIFDGPTNYSSRLMELCSSFTQPVTSTGQLMYIRFSVNTVARKSGFSLLYHQVLQPEGLTDSSNSNSGNELKRTGLVGGVLGATLLVVTLAFIFVVCYKRLSRKQKQTPKISGNNGAASNHSINPTALPTNDDEDTGLTSDPSTSAPPTSTPPTSAPPTSAPTTSAPLTSAPPTSAPSTSAPPTFAPSTSAPPTSAPSTFAPPTFAPSTSAPPTFAPSTSAPLTSAPTTSAPLTSAQPTSTSPTKKPKHTPKTRGKKKAASNHIPLKPSAPPANDDEDTDLTFAPPTSASTSSLYPNLSYIKQEDYTQAERSTGGALAVPAPVSSVYNIETERDNPAFINDPSTVGNNTLPVYREHSDV